MCAIVPCAYSPAESTMPTISATIAPIAAIKPVAAVATVAAVADLLGSGQVRLNDHGKIIRAKVC